MIADHIQSLTFQHPQKKLTGLVSGMADLGSSDLRIMDESGIRINLSSENKEQHAKYQENLSRYVEAIQAGEPGTAQTAMETIIDITKDFSHEMEEPLHLVKLGSMLQDQTDQIQQYLNKYQATAITERTHDSCIRIAEAQAAGFSRNTDSIAVLGGPTSYLDPTLIQAPFTRTRLQSDTASFDALLQDITKRASKAAKKVGDPQTDDYKAEYAKKVAQPCQSLLGQSLLLEAATKLIEAAGLTSEEELASCLLSQTSGGSNPGYRLEHNGSAYEISLDPKIVTTFSEKLQEQVRKEGIGLEKIRALILQHSKESILSEVSTVPASLPQMKSNHSTYSLFSSDLFYAIMPTAIAVMALYIHMQSSTTATSPATLDR